MLTSIKIRNFKKFDEIEFELGKAVVLIGPNNSGKTAALQALALWNIGLSSWNSRRGGKSAAKERTGVTINRRDLSSVQVPHVDLLWMNLDTRHATLTKTPEGKNHQDTKNIRIDISVEGLTNQVPWSCGLEFDYANPEFIYCRPLRLPEADQYNNGQLKRMPIPDVALSEKMAFLPPMSGLADKEYLKQSGEIGDLLGQGQTAQVLRNLCYNIYRRQDKSIWEELIKNIDRLFGISLLPPKFLENAEITMEYKEASGVTLDISSSGRGLQQTLLLLAHLYANPGSVLLLDEPDAHLEILRQRQIYQLLTTIAEINDSQLIIASHSEIVLNEAADRDVVVSFIGKPHRIDDRGHQLLKSLKSIGYDQYLQAEQRGWVLYLEGPTDLAVLQVFAEILNHEAKAVLENPFVHYVEDQPKRAREHFYGLLEAKPDLKGIAIFDRIDKKLGSDLQCFEIMWRKRELENYLCMPEVLLAFAQKEFKEPLFIQAMEAAISEIEKSLRALDLPGPWSPDIKASDEVLDRIFKKFYNNIGLPVRIGKRDYHELTQLVPKDKIDPEIVEKLDLIVQVAKSAKPRVD